MGLITIKKAYKNTSTFIFLVLMAFAGYTQVKTVNKLDDQVVQQESELNWITFKALNDSIKVFRKPILIFIHASWCKFCRMQENNSFRNPEVVKVLKQHFYCLKLDGEEKEDIKFLNRNYSYHAMGANTGSHQLAEFLGKENGALSYPTTCILSKQFQLIFRKSGFINAEDLLEICKLTQNH